MSSKKKKLNWMAGLVIDRKVTVNQGRAALGSKPLPAPVPARPPAQKSARPAPPAQVPPAPSVPRYAGDEEYLRSAFAPIPRPAVTKAAVPGPPRESPQQVLMALKSMPSLMLAAPDGPARSWTPAGVAMWREAEMISDPHDRERLRSHVIARLEGSVT